MNELSIFHEENEKTWNKFNISSQLRLKLIYFTLKCVLKSNSTDLWVKNYIKDVHYPYIPN